MTHIDQSLERLGLLFLPFFLFSFFLGGRFGAVLRLGNGSILAHKPSTMKPISISSLCDTHGQTFPVSALV